LEDGDTRDVVLRQSKRGLTAPAIDRPGYHRLETSHACTILAIAPRRAFTVRDAAPGRLWGVGVQAYGITDDASPGFGDFGALARFSAAAGQAGAGLVATSPFHALFAADPSRFSPYAPSSRLFLNGLMADPRVVFPEAPPPAAAAGDELIDWAAEWPARLARLRELHGHFRSDDPRRDDFERFRREGGDDLESHALFEALHGRFFAQCGARGWPDWPAHYHDRRSRAVAAFAREAAEEVEFHVFLQWLARRSLDAAQSAARRVMPIGLVADLAVGTDPGGSHAWSRPGDLLGRVNVGAPPDLLGPSGQDWGIAAFSPTALRATGYAPFLATLRAALASAGGVRIDHAMGLQRLWLVPRGASPTDGAYLAYPFADLIRLLTLESHRARAIVIAEDLGTVPAGFRETLKARSMMGMQVLWFERTDSGGFRAPGRWSRGAAAMTTTHDLPTVAGWWRERDIDWTWRIGRKSPHATKQASRAERAVERRRLWRACQRAGQAQGAEPPPDAPDAAVDAVIGFVAQTPADLAIVAAEDLVGLPEQPNLPGTVDEHPNWRRRLPPTDVMWADPAVQRRVAILGQHRPSS
ncbi:MAG TPA: 4-alpha-glucanotransferase, partial [Caulobacteraceae bacterium]|nr:4-alpha-glucanotransferase [Caulobacteraceae bacterium]